MIHRLTDEQLRELCSLWRHEPPIFDALTQLLALRARKTPATMQLVNLSKSLLDDARAECAELRARVAQLERAQKLPANNALYLTQLRASAIEQSGKDGFTWIAPSHVLNLLNLIDALGWVATRELQANDRRAAGLSPAFHPLPPETKK